MKQPCNKTSLLELLLFPLVHDLVKNNNNGNIMIVLTDITMSI